MASQLEKDSTGSLRGGLLRPEIIINRHTNYRDMESESTRAHIEWLKESIKLEGVKKPIDVSFADGKWYLEAGECRLTAAQELRKEGWDGFIPCFQVKGDEATILAKSLIDNTGLPPTLLEVGKAIQQLVDWGWSIERAAKCIPPSIATDPAKMIRVAKNALELNAAPIGVKEAVTKGVDGVRVTEAAAIAAVKRNPLQATEIVTKAAQDAKAKGKTKAMRPKGEGKVGKAKAATAKDIKNCLEKADALAGIALDRTMNREEVILCAKAYNKARGR
jgi:ParB-like chromosome segregation protein Spo0J